MPSYKTHSIHGEIILPNIDLKTDIDMDDLKTFCIGPDTIMVTNYKIFNYQHENKVKEYFETLLRLIKQNKLQENKEVMAFLYGQLDHYILDVIMHPLIYFMTENMPNKCILTPHCVIEMWIDDYIIKKFNKNDIFYYNKKEIKKSLKQIIDMIYKKVYNSKFAALKYKSGIISFNFLDTLVRRNNSKIAKFALKKLNLNNITYNSANIERVMPYLNLNNNAWINPETGETCFDSFDDLWKTSIEKILETINDVNKFLYLDKELHNPYISNNISYNTGLPCEKSKVFNM